MSGLLLLEQSLNGLQFGLMLFLLAAGLTLVFGIMDMINLAHGSLYMVGAFLAAWFVQLTGSFVVGVLLAHPRVVAAGPAHLNLTDARGRTALHIAAQRGHAAVVLIPAAI